MDNTSLFKELNTDSLIFDIDGTLWDSRETVAKAWNYALSKLLPEYRLPIITKEALTPLFGLTMDKICAKLLPGVPPERQAEVIEKIYGIQSEFMRREPGALYEGVPEDLKLLSERYPLFIVSNCQKGYIDDLLDSTGLRPLFKDGLCYGDTGLQKSETMKMLIKRNGLKFPVYIGDTKGDAEASRLAGVPFIWVSYGLGNVDKSDYIRKIDKFSELISF